MIRQSSSAGPCKYLHNQNKKLCKIFAKERREKKKKEEDFANIYRKCTVEPYSFFVNDTTLASDNLLRFRKLFLGYNVLRLQYIVAYVQLALVGV